MNLFPLVFHVGDALTRRALEGAIFELSGRCGAFQSARSNECGICCFDCLPPGHYSMTETFAPPGYRRSPKTYCCDVSPCGQCFMNGIPTGQVLVVNYPECRPHPCNDDIVRFAEPPCETTCL